VCKKEEGFNSLIFVVVKNVQALLSMTNSQSSSLVARLIGLYHESDAVISVISAAGIVDGFFQQ
jgi:hypothetical protein